MAANNAAKNKAIRQEAIRDQLTNGGHIQHVVDIAKKLQEQHLAIVLEESKPDEPGKTHQCTTGYTGYFTNNPRHGWHRDPL